MIKVDNIEVWGFRHALRGMRNPKNSWSKSDTVFDDSGVNIGPADLKLMQSLYQAGTEHRKFLRMIHVGMDVTSNHFWWQEFDTYKVGTVRNSCSKMHKIHVKEFVVDDFSHEGIDEVGGTTRMKFEYLVEELEFLRLKFNLTQERRYWRAMLELLPMGYNLRATIDLSYETVFAIIHQREGHKVFEWQELIDKTLKNLPGVRAILGD